MSAPSIEVLHELVKPAREALSKETWDYLMGGADTETTLERNRLALEEIAFRPRVLRDVSTVDLSTTFLGHKLRLPIILAPIGSLQDFCPPGGIAPTKAAAAFGVLHMLSSVCKPGLEDVAAAAPNYPKLFQLYVRGDAAWVDERVTAAVTAGYAGLCLTVDLDYYGRRERDISKRYKPTARRASGSEAAGDPFQQAFTWQDIARIRKNCPVPMFIKGIATPEDARIAVDHGIEVVYVSNHGGRQLDHGRGSVADLPDVVDAVKGKCAIVVDGGIYRGTDIVKAVALGADAVGIGRLQGLALAAGGEAALTRALELLEDETRRVVGLLGVTRLADVDRSHLARATPLSRRGFDSPFPLIKEDY